MSSSDRSLSSEQVRELDRIASERFGIGVDWLMEAAGWQLARACTGRTTVVCGAGNNGGDGLAAARHLHRWGRLSSVCCVDRVRLRGDALRELDVLLRLNVEVNDEPSFGNAEMVLDAIFGTGLNRAPTGEFAKAIEAINGSGLRVVAVDVPSGLDADSGVAYAPCVRADTTLSFTLPKTGLLLADGPGMSGKVELVDIGIPDEALRLVLR